MDDFEDLSWDQFELLVRTLLEREEYYLGPEPRPGTRAADIEALTPDGKHLVIEVKHLRQSIVNPRRLNQLAEDIERYRQGIPDTTGLLVFSCARTETIDLVMEQYPQIEAWFGEDVKRLMAKYPDIERQYEELVKARKAISNLGRRIQSGFDKDIQRLLAIPKGKDGWREYELVCTEILTKLFSPALGPPDRQTRSEDKLDIMDAVFPIRAQTFPWTQLRTDFATRFVVAEFKNYTDPIRQGQVASTASYLLAKAQRNFALLVTRLPPSDSALMWRRKAWMEESKMIVILTDDDLVEMMQLHAGGQDPFTVIDAHLEKFLITLST